MAKVAAVRCRNDAVCQTSDHHVDQLLLNCPNDFRKREKFWRDLGKVASQLMELQQALHEVGLWSNEVFAALCVELATNYRFTSRSKLRRFERDTSQAVVP
jgi:hypothetical protein